MSSFSGATIGDGDSVSIPGASIDEAKGCYVGKRWEDRNGVTRGNKNTSTRDETG